MTAQSNLRRVAFLTALSAAVFCFLPYQGFAGNSGTNVDEIIVRSRLALPGNAVTRMFLEESNGRNYLYIEQAQQAGYLAVDVSDDRHPRIIKEVLLPRHFGGETLEVFGAGLGIAGRPDHVPNSGSPSIAELPSQPSRQFVRLLDMTNASHPRTLKTFDGVTSVVVDDRHKMIYLTNGEGLWILHHRIDEMHAFCEEESQYSAVPLLCTGD